MASVILYTKSYCPFSTDCKKYLDEKGVPFMEKLIDDDPAMTKEMETKSGGRTDTPQVFINEHHIGSFDDMKALEATDKLNEMLDL
ncbi:glutaredoxin 3 [Candidatus Peregrinibacteria bacterium]|jgi:glutaredoxin 3|nr:glutaredoxin 3 [Candidatus Peregrinibacteria bacterium]MBT7736689.1 glutaredoxin 3 [Candidatus Peregrinibacteria bacterium]